MTVFSKGINLTAAMLRYLSTNPLSKGLYPTQIGMFHNGSGGSDRPDGYPTGLAAICLGGRGFVRTSELDAEITAGRVFLLPANRFHRYGSRKGYTWDLYWVHLDGELVGEFIGSRERGTVISLTESAMQQVTVLFQDFYRNVERSIAVTELNPAVQQLRHLIAVIRAAEYERTIERNASAVQRAISYMQQHITEAVTVTDFAREAECSRSHFSLIFKQRTGFGPLEFFNSLKIRRACTLLATTNLRIGEIGEAVGIENQYYFSRLFKKVMGTPPRIYREQRTGLH